MTEPSTDLAVIPLSGEAIDLATASPGQLAHLLSDLRNAEGQIRDIKRRIGEHVHARMDDRAEWTIRDGPWTLKGRSPAPVVAWDVPGLMDELGAMVLAGDLAQPAAERAIKTTVDYKVVPAGLKALLKLPGVAARLEPFRREVDPDRRLTVSGPA